MHRGSEVNLCAVGEGATGSPHRRLGTRRVCPWTIALALYATAWPVGLLSGCADSSPPSPARQPSELGADQILHDVVLRETADGKLDWVLRASKAYRNEGSEETRLDSLSVDFYEGAPEIRSVLTSDSGRVDAKKGILIAVGNVIVRTKEGNRLETERLIWNRLTSRVKSDTLVRMIRGDDVLTGIGFESDPDLTTYTLERSVRASVHDDGGLRRELEVTGDGDARP